MTKVYDCADFWADETTRMPKAVRADLIYHGMVFLTEVPLGGHVDYGRIIARDIEHAKARAEERGANETVLGPLLREGDAD